MTMGDVPFAHDQSQARGSPKRKEFIPNGRKPLPDAGCRFAIPRESLWNPSTRSTITQACFQAWCTFPLSSVDRSAVSRTTNIPNDSRLCRPDSVDDLFLEGGIWARHMGCHYFLQTQFSRAEFCALSLLVHCLFELCLSLFCSGMISIWYEFYFYFFGILGGDVAPKERVRRSNPSCGMKFEMKST